MWRRSRYVVGWSSLVGVLAAGGGTVLFVMVSSFEDKGLNGPVAGPARDFRQPLSRPAGGPLVPAARSAAPNAQAPGQMRPKPTRTPTARPSPPANPYDGVEVTSPDWGERVDSSDGVVIEGTAGDLGDRTLRLFDYTGDGMWHLIDGDGVDVPASGRWSLRYRSFGWGRSPGSVLVLTAVLADGECRRTLDAAEPGWGGDRVFRDLPSGCAIADRVAVVKT